MHWLSRLADPAYVFRPAQALRRARQIGEKNRPEFTETDLPWGLTIRSRPHETIGQTLYQMGVFELPISETLWRLTDPGDHALDIGANIGYMTSILAARIGAGGSVVSFEPHPEIFQELAFNVTRWASVPGVAPITTRHIALSDQSGEVRLNVSDEFASNRGTAWIGTAEGMEATASHVVPAFRLDDLDDLPAKLGMIKIDVQGHEASVFAGAERLLSEQRVRDIVLEEENPYPSLATEILCGHGYTLFHLGKAFGGPFLHSPDAGRPPRSRDTMNYVATIDPERIKARLSPAGWSILKPRPPAEH